MAIFVNPKKVIEVLDIKPGMKIADLGCGIGHYSFAIAEKLKGDGRIYAVDVRKNVLEKLASDARERDISVIDYIWGDVEKGGGTRLADEEVDIVVASNLYFQVEDKKALTKEVYRILVPGGKFLAVDWTDSYGGLGPADESIVSPDKIKDLCKDNLFSFEEESNVGAHHYALLFKK